jgi:hypothetical protein
MRGCEPPPNDDWSLVAIEIENRHAAPAGESPVRRRPPVPMPQPVEAPPPAQSARLEVDPIFGLDLSKYRKPQGDIDPITGLDLSKYKDDRGASGKFDVMRTLTAAQHGQLDPVTGLDLSKYAQPQAPAAATKVGLPDWAIHDKPQAAQAQQRRARTF